MATYNDLPIELTAAIFSYLRQERRQPCHCQAIKGMVREIDDSIVMGDYEGKVRVPYAVYSALGDFLDYEHAIDCPEIKIFNDVDIKWYKWWNNMRMWRLIALWYINIVSARLNEEDYRRILDAYVGEGDNGVDDYMCDDDAVVISEWVLK